MAAAAAEAAEGAEGASGGGFPGGSAGAGFGNGVMGFVGNLVDKGMDIAEDRWRTKYLSNWNSQFSRQQFQQNEQYYQFQQQQNQMFSRQQTKWMEKQYENYGLPGSLALGNGIKARYHMPGVSSYNTALQGGYTPHGKALGLPNYSL